MTSNPTPIDRRDVAHSTNPIGGQTHIEEIDKPNRADPLDAEADKLPAGGSDAAVTGMPQGARDDLPGAGLPRDVPPARTGRSGEEVRPAAPDEANPGANPGRLDQLRAEGRDTTHVQSPRPSD